MYRYVKRFFDIILSLLFIIILSPLILITFLILKLNLGGKIFETNIRYGRNMEHFTMYKMRTLKGDRSMQRDERVTKVSKIIRSAGLDELPQLLNILKGDMSIVGPRPFLVKDHDDLPENSFNPKRYAVKPGIFGYAQAKGRRDLMHDEKIYWDLKYVDEISFWTDLKLFFMTGWTVFIQFFQK